MIDATTGTISKAEDVAASVTEAALEVRNVMGTNLLNEVYEWCLLHEFQLRGLNYKTHVSMPVTYGGTTYEDAYVIDILFEDSVIVKVKPVCSKPELYKAHVQSFMKHSGYPVGILLDFDAKLRKNCVCRVAL